MALIYQAQIAPTKIEMLTAWVPSQSWAGGASELEVIGAYRFDDPAGEVGIETHLLRTGGVVLQVPLTYRGAPLAGAEDALLGTMQHSVLGERWVYDGCADPVYVNAIVAAILTGGVQADFDIQTDTGPVRREPTTLVKGSGAGTAPAAVSEVTVAHDGATTRVTAGDRTLVVRRALNDEIAAAGETLRGTWPGQDEPVVLATLS